MIYAIVGGIGFVFLLLSAIFDFDHADTDIDGPNLFSIKMFAMYAVGFGAGGGIAFLNGWPVIMQAFSSCVGIGALGIAGMVGFSFLQRSQADSTISDKDFTGVIGRVTIKIPQHGIGEIQCQISDRVIHVSAFSKHSPLEVGSQVCIESKKGSTVYVSPVSLFPNGKEAA